MCAALVSLLPAGLCLWAVRCPGFSLHLPIKRTISFLLLFPELPVLNGSSFSFSYALNQRFLPPASPEFYLCYPVLIWRQKESWKQVSMSRSLLQQQCMTFSDQFRKYCNYLQFYSLLKMYYTLKENKTKLGNESFPTLVVLWFVIKMVWNLSYEIVSPSAACSLPYE